MPVAYPQDVLRGNRNGGAQRVGPDRGRTHQHADADPGDIRAGQVRPLSGEQAREQQLHADRGADREQRPRPALQEAERQLQAIGSTQSGTGAALVRRMSRTQDVRLVKDSAALKARCRIETVAPLLNDAIDKGDDVIVEGTQGFGLSLLHGSDYPYVTSRDTTSAGFAMEVGLSPLLITKIVMVLRTFPIRVGGNSGPLSNEISWSDVRKLSSAPADIPEYTSVTNRLRRVARFDLEMVLRACNYNRPTSLAVMGLDRLDYGNSAITEVGKLTDSALQFLEDLEFATRVRVEFVGTGFGTFDVVAVPVSSRTSPFQHA